jgi:hypothetical protein
MIDSKQRKNITQIKGAVNAAISRKTSEDCLLSLLEEELNQLCKQNKKELASKNEVYSVYEMLRSSMTVQERDQMFLALLNS